MPACVCTTCSPENWDAPNVRQSPPALLPPGYDWHSKKSLLSVIVIQQKWTPFRIPFDSRSPFASCRWQSFHNQWVSYHPHPQVRCSFYSAFQFIASKNDKHGRVGSQSGDKWETPHRQACSPTWSPPPLFPYNAPASQKFQSQIGSEIPLNCIPRSVVCSGKVICCKNFLNSEHFCSLCKS